MKTINDIKNILYTDYPNSKHYINWYIRLLLINENNVLNGDNHHMLPVSLYPQYSDKKWNIVYMSYRRHYLCHYLLFKITCCVKMGMAFRLMNNGKVTNSILYDAVRKDINLSRKNYIPVYNIKDKKRFCFLIHRDDFDSSLHAHVSKNTTWYTDVKTNKSYMMYDNDIRLVDNKDRYIKGYSHDCTPSKIYWNGNVRVESDDNIKNHRNSGYEDGLKVMNDKKKIKMLNIVTKKYELINSSCNSTVHINHGSKVSKIRVIVWMDVQFLTRISLPFFIREKYFKIKDNNSLKNMYNSGYVRYNKHPKFIIDYVKKNKGISYYDLGFRCYSFVDYNVDFKKPIVTQDKDFYEYIRDRL